MKTLGILLLEFLFLYILWAIIEGTGRVPLWEKNHRVAMSMMTGVLWVFTVLFYKPLNEGKK